MPNLTPVKHREHYHLYQNKPCVDETSLEWLNDFTKSCGCSIGFNEFGDSYHFVKRTQKPLVL